MKNLQDLIRNRDLKIKNLLNSKNKNFNTRIDLVNDIEFLDSKINSTLKNLTNI